MGTQPKRQPAAETRAKITEAAATILAEQGIHGTTVSAIMEQAGVSRTAFYRQFNDLSGVIAAVLEILVEELFREAGDWFTDEDAVGSRDVVWENALRDGRSIKPRIRLFSAIVAATALDESFRRTWQQTLIQPWIDATAAAIRRDQAAGAVCSNLDSDATALALTLMSVQLALEVLGRQNAEPEDYAAILTPIWDAVLFSTDPLDQPERTRP